MYQPGNRDHIEAALGTVRYLLGEFDLKEPFRAFVDGLEWLNDTMRLNGAF